MSLDELSGQSGGVAGDTGALGTQDNAELPKDAVEFEVVATNEVSNAPLTNTASAQIDQTSTQSSEQKEAAKLLSEQKPIHEELKDGMIAFKDGFRDAVRVQLGQRMDDVAFAFTSEGKPVDMAPERKPIAYDETRPAGQLGHMVGSVASLPGLLIAPLADSIAAERKALKMGETAQDAQKAGQKAYGVGLGETLSLALSPVGASVVQGVVGSAKNALDGKVKDIGDFLHNAAVGAMQNIVFDKVLSSAGRAIFGHAKGRPEGGSPPNDTPHNNLPPTAGANVFNPFGAFNKRPELVPATVEGSFANNGVRSPHGASHNALNNHVLYSKSDQNAAGSASGSVGENVGETGVLTVAEQTAQDRATLFKPDRNEGYKGIFHQAKPVEGLPHLSEIKFGNGANILVKNDFLNGFLHETPSLLNDAKDLIRQVNYSEELTPVKTKSGQELIGKRLGMGRESVAYYMQYEGREPIVVKVKSNLADFESNHTEKTRLIETIIDQKLNLSTTELLADLPLQVGSSMRAADKTLSYETKIKVNLELPETYLAISGSYGLGKVTDITFSKYYKGEQQISLDNIEAGNYLAYPIQKYMNSTTLASDFELDNRGKNIWASVKDGVVNYAFFDPLFKPTKMGQSGSTNIYLPSAWLEPPKYTRVVNNE